MRKIILSLLTIIFIFSLVACSKKDTIKATTVDNVQPTKFTQSEITKAIDCVKSNFKFPACTLKKVWFDEEKSNTFATEYINNGRGSTNGVRPENVIVLLSTFDVDGSGDNPVLTPNYTYSDYRWVLIRDSKDGTWVIDDNGY